MNIVTLSKLLLEERALNEIILDIEERLKAEGERYYLAGNSRTVEAHTWREGTKISLINYKKQLVSVQKRLRELETPDEVIKQAFRDKSFMEVLRLWRSC